ncbi:MAG: hypothetical protein RJA07_1518 [Bacteroidota bacterium]|jgi:hypothetical protein
MNKSKYFIYLMLLLMPLTILVVGCSKKKKYKLSGVIYNSCGEPAGKIMIDIRQRSTAFVDYSGGSLKSFKTNSDGTFEYTYKTLDNATTPLAIFDGTAADANLLMSGIPANSDEIVDIYREKKVNFTFTLNFDTLPIPHGDTLYTKKDTLFAGAHQFSGTFHNGQVIGPIVENQDVNFYGWEKKVYTFCWGVNRKDFYHSINSLGRYNEYRVIKYQMTECDETTNINIPIK